VPELSEVSVAHLLPRNKVAYAHLSSPGKVESIN
jgi:hypothetical protein